VYYGGFLLTTESSCGAPFPSHTKNLVLEKNVAVTYLTTLLKSKTPRSTWPLPRSPAACRCETLTFLKMIIAVIVHGLIGRKDLRSMQVS